jgi:hypothetical protein
MLEHLPSLYEAQDLITSSTNIKIKINLKLKNKARHGGAHL